jgi:hypothetical protein
MTNTSVTLGSNSENFDLLVYYSFDSEHYPQVPAKVNVLDRWLKTYPESWIRLALIESLYQGRYKVFCVEQLLAHWQRRGYPVCHFSHEFEDLVCHDVPRKMGQSEIPTQQTRLSHTKQKSSVQTEVNAAPDLPLSEPWGELTEASLPEPEIPISSPNPAPKGEKVRDLLEEPWGDTSGSGFPSMFNIQQMLPVTVGRLGLEPIHQFIPEAQPIEFCEKLDAIARAQP